MDDADDPMVDPQVELRQRDGLDVPDELLRSLAAFGDEVDLRDTPSGRRDDPRGAYAGEGCELFLEDLEVEALRAAVHPLRDVVSTMWLTA